MTSAPVNTDTRVSIARISWHKQTSKKEILHIGQEFQNPPLSLCVSVNTTFGQNDGDSYGCSRGNGPFHQTMNSWTADAPENTYTRVSIARISWHKQTSNKKILHIGQEFQNPPNPRRLPTQLFP